MSKKRPAALFIADHRALDFLNTIAAPAGEPIEWLGGGDDLLDWLLRSGTIDRAVAARFRGKRGIDRVAAEARQLREWLRQFVKRHAGKPLRADAIRELRALNRLLKKDDGYSQVVARAGFRWAQKRRWTTPEQLLQPIAAAIGDLICNADFRYVRECEWPACTLMFLDRSKTHRRRWCSMALCGNRAKAAAHRARQRSGRRVSGRAKK